MKEKVVQHMKACLIFIAVLLYPSLSRLEQKTDVDKCVEAYIAKMCKKEEEFAKKMNVPWSRDKCYASEKRDNELQMRMECLRAQAGKR
jgi:hypothetical protein